MRYIKQDYIKIKPVNYMGNVFYEIGSNDWNIMVGLGGLVELKNQADKIIKDYINELDKEI